MVLGTGVVGAVALAQLLTGTGGPIAFGQNGTSTSSSSTSTTAAPPPINVYKAAIQRGATFYLKNSLNGGFADASPPSFGYGNVGDIGLMCDVNNDRTRTPTVRRNSQWTFFIRHFNSTGVANDAIAFGNEFGDIPLCGDWDGNGSETIGVYRTAESRFYLFNRQTVGTDPNGFAFQFGDPGDVPVVGDWDGNGTTTVGIKRGFQYFLRNSNSSGFNDVPAFFFGNTSDLPIVGDWDGNRTETIGVVRPTTMEWFLKNAFTTGNADRSFVFGNSGDRPLVWMSP